MKESVRITYFDRLTDQGVLIIPEHLQSAFRNLRTQNKLEVVSTFGIFDGAHMGHLDYFVKRVRVKYGRNIILHVSIDTDRLADFFKPALPPEHHELVRVFDLWSKIHFLFDHVVFTLHDSVDQLHDYLRIIKPQHVCFSYARGPEAVKLHKGQLEPVLGEFQGHLHVFEEFTEIFSRDFKEARNP